MKTTNERPKTSKQVYELVKEAIAETLQDIDDKHGQYSLMADDARYAIAGLELKLIEKFSKDNPRFDEKKFKQVIQ